VYDGPSIIIAGNGSYTGRTTFYFGKFDLYQRTYACTIKEGFNKETISFLYYMMKCLFEPIKMGGT
ncbi:MAG: restriction endonuclease subunit S, partial [Bacteroidaceae bacterium]|nr:restriction endonuclease subunit S [Bacteroidaceae bacterium]